MAKDHSVQCSPRRQTQRLPTVPVCLRQQQGFALRPRSPRSKEASVTQLLADAARKSDAQHSIRRPLGRGGSGSSCEPRGREKK